MIEYKEAFRIGRKTYGIEDRGPQTGEYRFKVWVGGCAIHVGTATIDEARRILHQYAVSQTRAEVGSANRAYAEAQATLGKLGDDPFSLGRFIL